MNWWIWIGGGILLLAIDVLGIGLGYGLWFGIAAIVTGVLVLVLEGMGLTAQLLVFSAASIIGLLVWARWFRPRQVARLRRQAAEFLPTQTARVIHADRGKGVLRLPGPVGGSDQWHFVCEESLAFGDIVVIDRLLDDGTVAVRRVAAPDGDSAPEG